MPGSGFAARRAAFRALHEAGCFVLPNPWDQGSAVRLQRLGFKALASSSAAAAWAIGLDDHQITLEQKLVHLEMLCAATDLPVNADFENGFADEPDAVAENVARALATGIAGLSIEDSYDAGRFYELDHAVARIAAARAAIDRDGTGAVLVARTEAYLNGVDDPGFAIERLQAYADAGADCLFAPGVTEPAEIAAMVAAVAPKPVNVLILNPQMKIAELAALGVRRVSLGSALAAAAWRGFDMAATGLAAEAGISPAAAR
jgi:2-methylisocitrate lyase-like PEP mutase family enzyme